MSTRQNLGFRLIEQRRRRMAANSAPNTPTISAGTLTSSGATLTGSAFSDPDVGDTHAASQWQVTTSADTGFASPVYNPGDDAVNKTSLVWSGGSASTGYLARVRYKDNHGNYSLWATSASFTTAAGGTTFTNAIHIVGSTDRAVVAAHAAYNDLSQFTLALLVRFDNTAGGLVASKHTLGSNAAGWSVDTTADLNVNYATTNGFKRAAFITADNTWQWFFLGVDRTNHLTTRSNGPQGGTIADLHRAVTDGGVGSLVSDAANPLCIGSDNGFSAARALEVRFVGIASSILSLANMQAIANDAVGQAALFVDYWKPSTAGGSGTSIPSGKSVLPAMVTTGATVV